MSKKNSFVCCICGEKCYGFGNNPDGAAWKDDKGEVTFPLFDVNDRCCDSCNSTFVVPGRLYQMAQRMKDMKKEK